MRLGKPSNSPINSLVDRVGKMRKKVQVSQTEAASTEPCESLVRVHLKPRCRSSYYFIRGGRARACKMKYLIIKSPSWAGNRARDGTFILCRQSSSRVVQSQNRHGHESIGIFC